MYPTYLHIFTRYENTSYLFIWEREREREGTSWGRRREVIEDLYFLQQCLNNIPTGYIQCLKVHKRLF